MPILKMKTPIQELMQHITTKGVKKYPLDTLGLIKDLLAKEKKFFKEAVIDGLSEVDFPKDLEEYSENYFNKKFNNL